MLLLLGGPASTALAQGVAEFARELVDLEAFTQVEGAPVRMESSYYDRTGGNNDGFNPDWLRNGAYTIADLPGVIRRFYSGTRGGQLRVYIDGNPRPVIGMPCEEFFGGTRTPFLAPVTGLMGGSNHSYFPIPYARLIRIQTTALDPKKDYPYGAFYQVTYQTFPKGTPVQREPAATISPERQL
jgi:hypothetical protein